MQTHRQAIELGYRVNITSMSPLVDWFTMASPDIGISIVVVPWVVCAIKLPSRLITRQFWYQDSSPLRICKVTLLLAASSDSSDVLPWYCIRSCVPKLSTNGTNHMVARDWQDFKTKRFPPLTCIGWFVNKRLWRAAEWWMCILSLQVSARFLSPCRRTSDCHGTQCAPVHPQ